VKSRVQKWGNSLAVRIPKPYAAEIGLDENAPVRLRVSEGALVITALSRRSYLLADLVAAIRRSNRHGEVPIGKPRGHEVW